MPTIYVKKTGSDSNSGSTQESPKLTIAAAVAAATNDRDIVEIIDEGTYAESQIVVAADGITLTHTGSGRPIIDASGLGSTEIISLAPNSSTNRRDFVLNGIEIKGSGNSSQELFKHNNNSTNANGLTVTDCFVYQVHALSNQFIQAGSGENINIKQSSFMFTNSNIDAIKFAGSGQFLIENCFLSRSSTGVGGESIGPILRSLNSGLNATASFSTFMFNSVTKNINIIKSFPKVINCVVSSTIGSNVSGIDAADHTFNVVNCGGGDFGFAFKNGSDASASAGTGETEATVTFIDGTSVGNTEAVVGNFALAEGSVGIDQGVTFNSVNVDIIGTTRPQGSAFDMGAFERPIPYWQDADNGEDFSRKFGGSFTIHSTANTLFTRAFPNEEANRQAPYYVTIPGPANLRGRTPGGKPYKAET
mgnify:CR=1 FL=1|tara:strand:+ start:1859 stop:3118 length:1260 start_codon:yes stop_codon:yes gene_type:complete